MTLCPKRDSANKFGSSSLQKITAALRIIAYKASGDFMDECVWIGESITLKC